MRTTIRFAFVLAALATNAAAQPTESNELSREIMRLQEQIVEMSDQVSAKNRELLNLQSRMADLREQHNAQLAERQRQIDTLTDSIAERDARIRELEATIGNLQLELARTSDELDASKSALATEQAKNQRKPDTTRKPIMQGWPLDLETRPEVMKHFSDLREQYAEMMDNSRVLEDETVESRAFMRVAKRWANAGGSRVLRIDEMNLYRIEATRAVGSRDEPRLQANLTPLDERTWEPTGEAVWEDVPQRYEGPVRGLTGEIVNIRTRIEARPVYVEGLSREPVFIERPFIGPHIEMSIDFVWTLIRKVEGDAPVGDPRIDRP